MYLVYSKFNLNKLLTIAISMLYLAACAPLLEQTERDLSDEIDSLLVTGLSDIQDYYITDINITDLALSGLKNIESSFDDLSFSVDNKNIQYKINHETVASAILPDDQSDVEETAFVLAQFIEDTKNASILMSSREDDEIISILYDGILEPLDKFSRYSGPSQALNERDNREGFGGIGIIIKAHPRGAVIEAVNVGDPAEAAGIHEGDIVVGVNEVATKGMSVNAINRLLRGPEDQSVKVSILRTGIDTPLLMDVGRKHIVPNTVFYRLENGHPVIRVTSFNQRTTKRIEDAVSHALQDINVTNKGLIIDLRNNPGGLLDKAVDTADLFLNSGILSQINGRNPLSDQLFFAKTGDITDGAPIIVLINGASASAAEILTAALQDNRRALVVGTNSFGKGSVQTVLPLPNTGELILTWAYFQSPKNYPLNEFGILPNLCTANVINGDALTKDTMIAHFNEALAPFKVSRNQLRDITPSITNFRRLCPWQPQTEVDVELNFAIQMLEDINYYNAALEFAASSESD